MIHPALAYSCLTAFAIMLPASIATYARMYQGSKSHFGYILMMFTFIDSLAYLSLFFINLYPSEIIVDNVAIQTFNVYTVITYQYVVWWVSL